MIKDLEIKNYKSIKDLKLECSRINLFVGKPNVGKSNILEAVSLLGNTWGKEKFSEYINYEDMTNLFYDRDIKNTIEILTDDQDAILKYFKDSEDFLMISGLEVPSKVIKDIISLNNSNDFFNMQNQFQTLINKHPDGKSPLESLSFLRILPEDMVDRAKIRVRLNNHFYYKFHKSTNFSISLNDGHLEPPFGKNLFKIIASNHEISNYLGGILKDEYKLDLVYDSLKNIFTIQKKIGIVVYNTPFSILADTLQRIIFYKAAIYSNSNAVLIFEEPEVNSFPEYIKELAEDIIDSKENQFFISTHNPYLFSSITENLESDLSLFLVDYQKFNTIVKKLSDEEISHMMDFGTDIFLNLDKFRV